MRLSWIALVGVGFMALLCQLPAHAKSLDVGLGSGNPDGGINSSADQIRVNLSLDHPLCQ